MPARATHTTTVETKLYAWRGDEVDRLIEDAVKAELFVNGQMGSAQKIVVDVDCDGGYVRAITATVTTTWTADEP